MEQWYAIQARTRRERQTAAAIHSRLFVPVFLPEIRCPRRPQILFPGYLFASVDIQRHGIGRLLTVPDVVRVVSYGDEPQAIPAETISALRRHLDQLETAPQRHTFQPGDPVRLQRGPLRGLDAVFDQSLRGQDRVRVLISFLGQLRQAEVDADDLEPIPPQQPPPPHQRGTRGRGRPIRRPGRPGDEIR